MAEDSGLVGYTFKTSFAHLRITKLQVQLASAELLSLHTEVEYYLFQGINGVLLSVGLGVHIVLFIIFALFAAFRRTIQQAYGSYTVFNLELLFLVAISLNGLVLWVALTFFVVIGNPDPKSGEVRFKMKLLLYR